ncbi:hypothetical protein [Promicromonospora panici]|uniref:hypothetical protein n=1 Tax=Promicromonospora panici TaxID=2219658 RepID=UPI00101E1CF1|nr:hypothetical protein [Promicromonospora panici]
MFDFSVPAAPVVALDDVRPLIMTMPAYWADGSELRWAEHAWGVLESEDLTTFQDPVEEVQVLCRVLTLTAVVRAFSDLTTGTNIDWKGALGTGPKSIAASLDQIALGRLAERLGVYSRLDGRETQAGLAAVVARKEWEEVTAALRGALGDTALFGSLWATRWSSTRYPLDDGALENVAGGGRPDKAKAFEWITEGMPLRP